MRQADCHPGQGRNACQQAGGVAGGPGAGQITEATLLCLEFGEEWHHAGRLAAKQNCFDDFIACADHLHGSRITSRERLAIMGGSNGGLLMGAVLTQRPDIAGAVVAAVPVMDCLRAETTTNGRFNTPEYGTVEDPELFTALLAYSPYHNVVDGTAYPAEQIDGSAFVRIRRGHNPPP